MSGGLNGFRILGMLVGTGFIASVGYMATAPQRSADELNSFTERAVKTGQKRHNAAIRDSNLAKGEWGMDAPNGGDGDPFSEIERYDDGKFGRATDRAVGDSTNPDIENYGGWGDE